MEKEQRVYGVLDELEIPYILYEHPPVFTVEEARQLDIPMEGCHCKNLFIRNRSGNRHYLVIVSEQKTVNLKMLAKQVSETTLSLASPERLEKYLGITPGSVGPFGLLYDTGRHVKILLDQDICTEGNICFHPNVNHATVSLCYRDFEGFLEWCGNSVMYVTI